LKSYEIIDRKHYKKCPDIINITGLVKHSYYAQGNYIRQPMEYNGRVFYKQEYGKYYIYYDRSGDWKVYHKRARSNVKVNLLVSSYHKCPPLTGWKENVWVASYTYGWFTIKLTNSEVSYGRSYYTTHTASNYCTEGYDYEKIARFGICTKPNIYKTQLRTKLTNDLQHISDVLPKNALEILSDLKVYFSNDNKYGLAIMTYMSASWLTKYGDDPKKLYNVQIANIRDYLDYDPNYDIYYNVLLHEAAHALQFRTGFATAIPIKAAYDAAMQRGLYYNVMKYDNSMKRAYAASNEWEYFAELSVSYFSQRRARKSYQGRFYPFYRNQLKSYDPNGYELCKKVWNTNFANIKSKYVETSLTKCHNRCRKRCRFRKIKMERDSCRNTCIIKCNNL